MNKSTNQPEFESKEERDAFFQHTLQLLVRYFGKNDFILFAKPKQTSTTPQLHWPTTCPWHVAANTAQSVETAAPAVSTSPHAPYDPLAVSADRKKKDIMHKFAQRYMEEYKGCKSS